MKMNEYNYSSLIAQFRQHVAANKWNHFRANNLLTKDEAFALAVKLIEDIRVKSKNTK